MRTRPPFQESDFQAAARRNRDQSTAQGCSIRALRVARPFSSSRLKISFRRGTANRASPATWKSTLLMSRQVVGTGRLDQIGGDSGHLARGNLEGDEAARLVCGLRSPGVGKVGFLVPTQPSTYHGVERCCREQQRSDGQQCTGRKYRPRLLRRQGQAEVTRTPR